MVTRYFVFSPSLNAATPLLHLAVAPAYLAPLHLEIAPGDVVTQALRAVWECVSTNDLLKHLRLTADRIRFVLQCEGSLTDGRRGAYTAGCAAVATALFPPIPSTRQVNVRAELTKVCETLKAVLNDRTSVDCCELALTIVRAAGEAARELVERSPFAVPPVMRQLAACMKAASEVSMLPCLADVRLHMQVLVLV